MPPSGGVRQMRPCLGMTETENVMVGGWARLRARVVTAFSFLKNLLCDYTFLICHNGSRNNFCKRDERMGRSSTLEDKYALLQLFLHLSRNWNCSTHFSFVHSCFKTLYALFFALDGLQYGNIVYLAWQAGTWNGFSCRAGKGIVLQHDLMTHSFAECRIVENYRAAHKEKWKQWRRRWHNSSSICSFEITENTFITKSSTGYCEGTN